MSFRRANARRNLGLLLTDKTRSLAALEMTAGVLFFIIFFLTGASSQGICFGEEASKASTSLDFADGLYARKMYGPAISEYQKFIQTGTDPADTASAYFRLADAYYFLKEYAKAVQNFEAFYAKFPEDARNPAALFRIGTARYFLKNYPGARRALSDIASTTAEVNIKSGALFYLAKVSHEEGKADEAVETLRELTAEYPQTDYALYACLFAGDIFASRKNEGEALRIWRLVADGTVRPPDGGVVLESAVEEASLKTADLYFSQKKYSDARTYYQNAYNLPGKKSPDRILTGLFYTHFYLKDLEASKRLLFSNEFFMNQSAGRFDVNYILAILAQEKKDAPFALERLDKILNDAKSPKETLAKAHAARAYTQAEDLKANGKLEEALVLYLGAGASDDNLYSARALYQAGFLSTKLNKNDQARRCFSDFLKKNPKGEDAERVALQNIQMDLGEEKWEAAADGAGEFLKKFPQSSFVDVALYKLGMGLTGLKNYDKASLVFENLILNFRESVLYPEAVYGAAASFDGAGQTRKAIEYYERFTAENPGHSLYKEALPRLGFLYVQNKNYEKAAKFYEDILLNQPEIPLESSTAFWVIRYDLGRSQYARMRSILTILSRRYPDEVLTHEINFFLGESLMGLKNYADALQYYSKSVEAEPEGTYVPYAYLGMGIASAAQGKIDTAENFFAKVLGFDGIPDAALRARFEIANLQLRRGHWEEASKAFMHVAILYDDEKYGSAALFKAGECFAKLGNEEEAQKVFQELVKRYPKTAWAHRAEDSRG